MARGAARGGLDIAAEHGALEVGCEGLHSEWIGVGDCGSEARRISTCGAEISAMLN